jgi:two-component system, LytTR family, response regulator
MLKAIIIDDELKGRIALRQKIADYCPGVEVAGEAATAEEGIEVIRRLQPQIVFLDIEMPGMNGFEMLKAIDQQNFHLIFTTAYDQYALKAFRFAAFDYLLKPVDIEELRQAVSRVMQQSQHHTPQKIEALEENLRAGTMLTKIAVPSSNGLFFYNLSDIVCLEAQSNYTVIHFLSDPKLVASRTLKEFEELLPPDSFFRAHHSYIINLHYIKRYIRGDGGQIEMQNGKYIDLARRKKELFLSLIK